MTNMQLMLPHITYPEYTRAYRKFKDRGDYIIMDNGAAEKIALPDNQFVQRALAHKVDELAVPDVLGDADKTFVQFLHFMTDYSDLLVDSEIRIGFVTQGKNVDEAIALIDAVMRTHWAPYVCTAFVPRLLVKKNNLFARITIAQYINKQYPLLNIHMFGASKIFAREALMFSKEVPYVRSIDTSMPFNYSIIGKSLDSLELKTLEIGRATDYFEQDCREVDLALVSKNVGTMMQWAGAYE